MLKELLLTCDPASAAPPRRHTRSTRGSHVVILVLRVLDAQEVRPVRLRPALGPLGEVRALVARGQADVRVIQELAANGRVSTPPRLVSSLSLSPESAHRQHTADNFFSTNSVRLRACGGPLGRVTIIIQSNIIIEKINVS